MPIDAFLRSLAEDQGERAVGIILSGTGTDGTLGLRAILGAGGMCLVQDPATRQVRRHAAQRHPVRLRHPCAAVERMPALLLQAAEPVGLPKLRWRDHQSAQAEPLKTSRVA
jgi:two-component system CheB/CheR fusion protein